MRKKEKIEPEFLKEINKLFDIGSYLEKLSRARIEYYGLQNLNPDKTYPLFVQWNYEYPMIGVSTSGPVGNWQEKYLPLPREIGYAIERVLRTVKNEEDFENQIKEAFRRKDEENKARAD